MLMCLQKLLWWKLEDTEICPSHSLLHSSDWVYHMGGEHDRVHNCGDISVLAADDYTANFGAGRVVAKLRRGPLNNIN
ncbi:hypothetical protein SUGI_1081930 [Cryptomeria japonica]|nr:hypothetical protein SUGI_1081930 [Cryptomeria japonica]